VQRAEKQIDGIELSYRSSSKQIRKSTRINLRKRTPNCRVRQNCERIAR